MITAKRLKIEIKSVSDFNEVACEIIEEFIEDFTERKGLTREPNEDDFIDFGHTDIGWMYTQKGMKLYDRACERLAKVGRKLFPFEEQNIEVKAYSMIFP